MLRTRTHRPEMCHSCAGHPSQKCVTLLQDTLDLIVLPLSLSVSARSDLAAFLVSAFSQVTASLPNRPPPAGCLSPGLPALATTLYSLLPQTHSTATMQTFTTVASLREFLASLSDGSLGFVPTMGNLHEGHASLVRESLKHNEHTVVSVFVNPSQFAPGEDLATYPRTLPEDADLLQQLGVTALFAPTVDEIYPDGSTRGPFVDPCLGYCTETLEGASRPQFFRGVATVVCKLLRIVRPNTAYFGQKDWQQLCVVRQLCRGLFLDVEIVAAPTVRGRSGLALSSRNGYLSPQQREVAAAIHRGLVSGREVAHPHRAVSAQTVLRAVRSVWEQHRELREEYLAVCSRDTLAPVETIDGPCVLLCAVYLGGVRLIDNELV